MACLDALRGAVWGGHLRRFYDAFSYSCLSLVALSYISHALNISNVPSRPSTMAPTSQTTFRFGERWSVTRWQLWWRKDLMMPTICRFVAPLYYKTVPLLWCFSCLHAQPHLLPFLPSFCVLATLALPFSFSKTISFCTHTSSSHTHSTLERLSLRGAGRA